MTKPSHRLRGTRHVVKARLAVVVVLAVLVLAYVSISFVAEARGSAETTSSQQATGAAAPTNRTSTTSTSSVATTSANSTKRPFAGLYMVDTGTLMALVNSTTAHFANSTGQLQYYVVYDHSKVSGLVFLTTDVDTMSSYGFRGPIGILVYLSSSGTIRSLRLWTSVEPMTDTITPEYLGIYTNRSVFDQLAVGSDVISITGATYSSVGIAGGVRDGGRMVVNDYKQGQIQTLTETTTVTDTQASVPITNSTVRNSPPPLAIANSKQLGNAGVIAVFFVAAVLAYERNDDRTKYGVLAAAVILLGVYEATMVSVTDVTIFLTGTLPPFLTNYYWYVLYAGTLLTSVIWGRLYCGSVCPFGAFIHLMYKVSPFRLTMPRRIQAKLLYLKFVVLALVVVGISWSALWVAGIEPFKTFFLLRGDSWTWGVLGLALLFSIPFDRFYCTYMCPAGAGLSLVGSLRILEINRWPECATCRICERDCPTGAISGGRISARECMNCRACEVNYSNPNICPHYALKRKAGAQLNGASEMSIPGALVFGSENRLSS